MTVDHLADFLLARLAEDEEVARASAEVNPPPWRVHLSRMGGDTALVIGAETPANRYLDGALWDNEGADSLSMEPATAQHIARHDPARVLAECAAKRAIVKQLQGVIDDPWTYDSMALSLAEDLLLALAQPYADHPEFHPSWARSSAT